MTMGLFLSAITIPAILSAWALTYLFSFIRGIVRSS